MSNPIDVSILGRNNVEAQNEKKIPSVIEISQLEILPCYSATIKKNWRDRTNSSVLTVKCPSIRIKDGRTIFRTTSVKP